MDYNAQVENSRAAAEAERINEERRQFNLQQQTDVATRIGEFQKAPGDIGKLAGFLLAGGATPFSTAQAQGKSAITPESLLPLQLLLGTQNELQQGPKLFNAQQVNAPNVPIPQFDPLNMPDLSALLDFLNEPAPQLTQPDTGAESSVVTPAAAPSPAGSSTVADQVIAAVTAAATRNATEGTRGIGAQEEDTTEDFFGHGGKTDSKKFVVGDPQVPGVPNPELVEIGEDGKAKVTPLNFFGTGTGGVPQYAFGTPDETSPGTKSAAAIAAGVPNPDPTGPQPSAATPTPFNIRDRSGGPAVQFPAGAGQLRRAWRAVPAVQPAWHPHGLQEHYRLW